jgi:hypothetical protein
MGSDRTVGRHLVDVGALLLLGSVYVFLLSLGKVTAGARRAVTSVWESGIDVAQASVRSAN